MQIADVMWHIFTEVPSWIAAYICHLLTSSICIATRWRSCRRGKINLVFVTVKQTDTLYSIENYLLIVA